MNFDELLNDIEKLVGIPLKAITPSTSGITLLSIDRDSKKYIVKSDGSSRETKRNFRELEAIFTCLKKDGYCNVEQALQGSFTSRHQPETVFANLPYIQFFKFERRKHLILRNDAQHPLGDIQELPRAEQIQARKTLSSNKNFSVKKFASNLDLALQDLKDEIDTLHLKQPGFLSDTNIPKVISELEHINISVQKITLSLDGGGDGDGSEISDEDADLVKNNNFDMSDLVDLSAITGVTDDKTGQDESIDDSSDLSNEENHVSELIIPNIRRQTPSIYALYQRLNYDEIEIQPDYQRQDRIWKDDKKSKLIESILMGLPLPIFYFAERLNDNWVVIDGLQRLTTVYDFITGKFSLKLDKNSPVYDANGKFFKDFDRRFARALFEFEITAYVIDMNDEPNSKHVNRFILELFHRINTYGVKLSDQEIRSAIKFGNSVFYLRFLATSTTFIKATNNTINPKRQKDLELCLGALAYIIFGYEDFKYNKYDDFLTNTMDWINKHDFKKINNELGQVDYRSESVEIVDLTSRFESSLNFCLELFGEHAFKKSISSNKREPISKTLFEVLVTIFSNVNEEQKEKIRKHKSEFVDVLQSAIKNDEEKYAEWSSSIYCNQKRGLNYSLSTSTGKKVTISYRFESILKIIEVTTGCIIKISSIGKDND